MKKNINNSYLLDCSHKRHRTTGVAGKTSLEYMNPPFEEQTSGRVPGRMKTLLKACSVPKCLVNSGEFVVALLRHPEHEDRYKPDVGHDLCVDPLTDLVKLKISR
jgi:hypothetical protein